MKKILFLFCLVFLFFGCRKEQPPDPRINELQKQVSELTDQVKKMEADVQALQQQLEEQKSKQDTLMAQTQPQVEKPKGMTLERAKREVEPLLKDSIAKLRKQMETPAKGKSFGMRVEYDLPRAIYGLVRTDNPAVPYRVKVIVRHEKYLESENESKTYGGGSTTFIFGYSKNRWSLEKTE